MTSADRLRSVLAVTGAAIVLLAIVLQPPSAGATRHRLRIDAGRYAMTKMGHFRPNRDATMRAAIRAFGHPTSIRTGAHVGCEVRWRRLRLRIKFENFGGGDPCTRRGGFAQSMKIRRSDRWRTHRGLKVGDATRRLRHLYPGATRHGRQWWLRTAISPFGTGERYAVLAARTGDAHRVRGFQGWIGGAGE